MKNSALLEHLRTLILADDEDAVVDLLNSPPGCDAAIVAWGFQIAWSAQRHAIARILRNERRDRGHVGSSGRHRDLLRHWRLYFGGAQIKNTGFAKITTLDYPGKSVDPEEGAKRRFEVQKFYGNKKLGRPQLHVGSIPCSEVPAEFLRTIASDGYSMPSPENKKEHVPAFILIPPAKADTKTTNNKDEDHGERIVSDG